MRESRSKQDFLALVRGRATEGVAVVHVEGLDETRWDMHELPTAHDFDAITPTPVVATRADGHISVVSSSTLAAIDLADADGVEVDAERHPTGRLTKEANRRPSRGWRPRTTRGRSRGSNCKPPRSPHHGA